MTIREFEYDLKKIKTLLKAPSGEYNEKDDAFILNFIIRFREFIKPLSIENRHEFEKSAKNYKKNPSKFGNTAEELLKAVKPIYDKISFEDNRRRKSDWHKKK